MPFDKFIANCIAFDFNMKASVSRFVYKGFLPVWFLPILLFVGVGNILYLFEDATRFGAAVDLRPLYCATKLWMSGENPYDDLKLREEWQKVPDSDKANLLQPPGFPLYPMVYPPMAVSLFAPIGLLPWKNAAVTWYCLNFFLLLGMIYFMSGWISDSKEKSYYVFGEVLLVLLAFKGTMVGFSTGQPAFLCLFAGFGSLYFYKKGNCYLSSVLLGISTFKISLVIPFILFFLIKKEYKILTLSAIVPVSLLLITIVYSPMGFKLLWVYSDLLKDYREMVYSLPHTIYRTQLTEFGVLFKALNWISREWISVFNLAIILLTLLFLGLSSFRKILEDKYVYVLAALMTFAAFHHNYYDMMALVPVICFLGSFRVPWNWLFYLLLLRLITPVNMLMLKYRVSTELFYYSLPLCILLLYVLFLIGPFRKSTAKSLCLNN